jgi:hypothetical protein
MRHSGEPFFVIEYLRKYESVLDSASACEPTDPVVLFAKIKLRVENLVTHSHLTNIFYEKVLLKRKCTVLQLHFFLFCNSLLFGGLA